MSEIKLCKGCKWYEFKGCHDFSLCKNRNTFEERANNDSCFESYMERVKVAAWHARVRGRCGDKAKYFEHKTTLLERVKGWLK